MKVKGLLFFLIVTIALVGGYFFISTNKKAGNGQDTKEEISQRDLVYKEFVDKYQAKTGWGEGLDYTIQAQERLISNTPILFEGFVDDVFIRDEKTFIIFDVWLSDVRLELECNQQVIDKFFSIEEESEGLFNTYAVVANIQEVYKPIFKIGNYILEDEDGTEAEIEIQSPELILAKGTCVDIAIVDEF